MKAKIIKLRQVDSTNLFCKRYCEKNAYRDLIVVAKRQTSGRGTKGRSFSSEKGGLYITVMRKYENFDFSTTFTIMINSCVAVCNALKEIGLMPRIKWANDVLIGDKKICGTLIENTLSQDNICISIVGMGINVNNALPEELRNIATTVREQTGRKFPINRVRNILIKNLQKSYTVADYKNFVDWFGQEVELYSGGKVLAAKAVDVDKDGSLVCEIDGELKKINSAEMSLRLKCSTM